MRYADRNVQTVDTDEKIQELVSAMNRNCVERGMEFNVGQERQVMGLRKIIEYLSLIFALNGRAVLQPDKHKHLACVIE